MFTESFKDEDKVFVLRDLIEIRIPLKYYGKLRKKYSNEYIISFGEPKRILNRVTGRDLVFITKESGIPLLGSASFGLIDRATNLIQVRPVTGCNLNCIFCSVDEGRLTKSLATDYVVEPDYLAEKLREIAKFKGNGVEAHIDGQGEPLLYPYLEELLSQIKKIREINIVSIQTNGTLLNEEMIKMLEKYVTRINLSLSATNPEIGRKIHRAKYSVEDIIESARMVVDSKMDLLIAPVWLPGYNDGEIGKIIELALEMGAGKKFPPLGIQKYIPYKHGRKLKKIASFKEFYDQLENMEEEYGIKLILKPEDFGMEKRQRIKHPIRKGDKFRTRLVCEGRMSGEKMAIVEGRVVTVKSERNIGEIESFEIVRAKDGIFLAR